MLVLLAATASGHVPVLHPVSPGEDWCALVRSEVLWRGVPFTPGDVVVLTPGEHLGCAWSAPPSDEEGELTVIRSEDPTDLATLAPGERLVISGRGVSVEALALRGGPAGAPAVFVHDADDVWLRGLRIRDGDVGVAFGAGISEAWLVDVDAADVGLAVDIDGPDGRVRVRGGLFRQAGVGVRAALGVQLEVADAVFAAVGTAVRAGGSDATSDLRANLVLDGEVGLDLSGAGWVVRSNIVRADEALRVDGAGDARVLGNSLVGAVSVAGADEIRSNASVEPMPGAVTCDSTRACWRDAEGGDFYPDDEGALRGAGEPARDEALFEDFCGRVRGRTPAAGAVEWVGPVGWPALTVAPKREQACVHAPLPTPIVGEEGPAGCGCALARLPGTGWLIAACVVLRRRRRAAPAPT